MRIKLNNTYKKRTQNNHAKKQCNHIKLTRQTLDIN